MTWTNALVRFVACPSLVAIADGLFAGIAYRGFWDWVIAGFALAGTAIAADMLLLDRMGHTVAFFADAGYATVIIWASQFLLPGTVITWWGAIGGGLLMGLSEIFFHRWVQLSRRRGVRENRP